MNGTDSTENIDNYLVKCAADSSSSSSETDRIRESIKSNSPTHFQREKVHATNSKDGRGELNPKRNESIVIAASALSMLGEDKNASRRLSGSGSLEENLIFQRVFASKSGDKAGENDDSDAGNKKPASSKKKSPITAQKYAAKHKFPREMPIIPQQRHIPSHKKSSCALTFPERLLAMLDYADKMKAELADHGHEPDTYCLSWLPDGKSFLVRDPVACTQTIIPLFFKQAKFTSITRKLYRWGFHQVERNNSEGPNLPPDAMIFANENFQRDARHKIANMKSMTTPNQNRKLESTPKREGGGENERTSSSAIAAGSNTLHLHAATSANGRNNDGNDVLSSGYARNPHQTLDLQSIIAAQSQQSQKRALLEGILASCNGNLSQVDPGIIKSLLFPQMNCGVPDSQSSHNAVIPPTVANTTSHPTLNLEQLLPLLRNCNGGNVINHHFNQQQQQNYQEQEKRSLLNSIGLKSPYSMVSMVPHHYPPSQPLPQQGLSTLRSGNLHENSMASVNNVFDEFLPYIQSASINTNPVAQDVVFSNEKNFSRLAQQQKPQQQQISRDDMNIHQALKTVMSQTMSSHQQALSASAPPPNHLQTAPLNRFQNLSHLQRDQLIQIFRFGAETLENGSIQEQDVILQIILSFLQNC